MTDIADRNPDWVNLAGAGHVPVRARATMADFLLHFWRAKWLILIVTIPILAIGFFAASRLPVTYESQSALYYTSSGPLRSASSLGDERFERQIGAQEALQGEVQILKTRLVAERTLSRFPLNRIYPDLASADFQTGIVRFQRAFSVRAEPGSNIIKLSFTHTDSAIAAELLNAAIAVYLNRRTELFGIRPIDHSGSERKRVEGDLLEADDAIRDFLDTNAIRDFVSERSTAQGLHSLISNELSAVNARKIAVQAQLARTLTQLEETAPEQEILIENSGAERLQELQVERDQALVNYTPESRRVQAIDQQIAELETLLEVNSSHGETVSRGPNPAYQALETSRNRLEAESDSLHQQGIELARQLQAVEDKLDRFLGLESEWNELHRNRDLIEANIRILAAQEQRSQTAADFASGAGNSVKVTEPATLPGDGRSMKWPMVVFTILVAGFMALFASLLHGRSRVGYANAQAFQRATGLPVLASVARV